MIPVASALLVTRDLMFSSQIEGLARSAGVTLQIASGLSDSFADLDCDLLILDLELPTLDFEELAERLKTLELPTVGYASHVKTHLFDSGRQAGIDYLVARGGLRERLQELFR